MSHINFLKQLCSFTVKYRGCNCVQLAKILTLNVKLEEIKTAI